MLIKFEQQVIKSYDNWVLLLYENQCYLGRTCLWAKRANAVDFIAMSAAERAEFFMIAGYMKKVLNHLFMPDLYNYTSLGNVTKHLHVHIVPRYLDTRTFDGLKFIDNRWGMNYAPEDESFDIGHSRFHNLKALLHGYLEATDKMDIM